MGHLNRSAIFTIMKRKRRALKRCFEPFWNYDPHLTDRHRRTVVSTGPTAEVDFLRGRVSLTVAKCAGNDKVLERGEMSVGMTGLQVHRRAKARGYWLARRASLRSAGSHTSTCKLAHVFRPIRTEARPTADWGRVKVREPRRNE